jgi:hypothetical protein
MHRESQAADLGYVVGCTGREARSGGRMGQKEAAVTATGKNRIMIFGPKTDGTYIIEFKTAAGEARAISVPAGETRVLKSLGSHQVGTPTRDT